MSGEKDWTRKELEEEIIGKMTAVTVPVNMRIEGQHRILDLTEMEQILRNAKQISLGECGCRKKMKKCDAPLDVCISLDKEADELVQKGSSRKASLSEALDALRRSHEAGLVHIAYTFEGNEKPQVICSCCSCCCHSMSALVRFGFAEAVVASTYIAVNNSETCINCGTCVERCQFKARHMEDGELKYDSAKCFGCGLCASTCPTKSISLTKRN